MSFLDELNKNTTSNTNNTIDNQTIPQDVNNTPQSPSINLPNMGDTTIKEAPSGFGRIFNNTVGTLKDTYNNVVDSGKQVGQDVYNKAYEGGAQIHQGKTTQGVGNIVSSAVNLTALPFSAVLNNEATGKVGETIGKVASFPFEVLHYDFSLGLLDVVGLNQQDSSNYADALAFMTLVVPGAIKGIHKGNPPVELEKTYNTFKNPDISPEIKKQFTKDVFIYHPDRYLKDEATSLKMTEYFKQANEALHTNDIITMQKVKEQAIQLRDEYRVNHPIKGNDGYIKNFFQDSENVANYKKTVEEVKNSVKFQEGTPDVLSIIDKAMFTSGLMGKVDKKELDNMAQHIKNEVFPPIQIEGDLKEQLKGVPDISLNREDVTHIPNKVKVYFGGKSGGVTGLSKSKGLLDVTEHKDYANRYKTKHGIKNKEQGTLYEGYIDKKDVFSIDRINEVKNQKLKEILLSYSNNGKSEINWKNIGGNKDGGLNIINGLQQEGFKAFTKQERPGITSISIMDKQVLQDTNLQEVINNTSKSKEEPNYTKDELFNVEKTDNSLGNINNFQETKAKFGIKDTIKSYNKFIDIRNLINEGILVDKGVDTKHPSKQKLRKFEFTDLAREHFNIGSNESDLKFLKKGVHYPDALYKQVSNKVKALKKNGKSLESQRTTPQTKQGQKKDNKKTKKDIKLTPSERIKVKKLTRELTKIYNQKTTPTQTEIAKLLNKYPKKLWQPGTDDGVEKNMIPKEFGDEIMTAIGSTKAQRTNAPTGRLSNDQKTNILDMLGFQSLFKKKEEFKINIPQLDKSLKEIQARLHIVNTPSGKRVKLPFTLMGNKSATFKHVLLPMIKKGIDQGAKRFVEPFGGAGTSYYFADEMLNYGLEEMHINHFDDEKYEVIKVIKEGKDVSVAKDVTEAFNTIVDEMGSVLAEIPEIKSIMDEYNVQVGTKNFKDMAEIFFYPQYAKQFFTERPDTKLGMKGEISNTFKEWLKEKVGKDTGFTGENLDVAVNEILTDPSVFETQYPQISKKISTILDKYDGVQIQPGQYKEALLKSMAKHLRQRGDSGQKVVSATSGFQSVLGAKEKMIDGLTKYQQVFNKHGDNIHIYNMDGKEFITKMGKSFNDKKTLFYGDPPYVRTTGTYIKQNPSLESSLSEYANPNKIHQIFEPMKDSMMMFTNDVDGKYFEALNTMLDGRMSKDIIAYKEGTTPTSLITTNEIAIKPKDVGLQPYTIFKNQFLGDINTSLAESLFPKIAKQLKKHIAKIEQHFMNKIQDKFGELLKIQDEVFTGTELRKDFEEVMKDIITGRDKQAVLNKYKKLLSQNKVRGADVVKIINDINKQWVDRKEKIKDLKKQIDNFKKISTIDVETKDKFFTWFNESYTTKHIPENRSKEVEAVDKMMTMDSFTPEEADIIEKYLSDEKYYNQIEEARKESIHSFDIDQLKEMQDTVRYYESVGKDFRKLKDLEFANIVEKERVNTEPTLKKLEEGNRLPLSERLDKSNRIKEVAINAKIKTKRALLEATPSTWILDEELNIDRAVYNLTDIGINNHRDFIEKVSEEFDTKTKELNITKEGWTKISLHGLARRSDGKGRVKIIAQLKADGDKAETFSNQIQEFAGDTFLSENEKEMYNYMQGKFKELGKKMRDTKINLDNEIVLLMDEYFPIQLDYDQNKEKFDVIDPLSFDNGSQIFRKVATKDGFTKQATGLEIIPDLRADKIFQSHVNNVSYYVNMQGPIKQLNKLVLDLGINKLGKLGFEYMKDYINVLARQGVMGNQNIAQRGISAIVKNFQTAVLGYNPVTAVLQTSAFLEAKAIGSHGNLKAYGKVLKVVLGDKSTWDMITQKSGVIRNREYRNMFGNETDKFDKGLLEKYNKYGFWGIQKSDAVTSRLVWYSEYTYQKEHGASEQNAIYEADTIIKKSMGHTHFEGKTQFVLNNERAGLAPLTVFQNFVLNHSAILRYTGGKRIKEKYKNSHFSKTKALMYSLAFAGLLFGIYEELIRAGSRQIHNQKNYSGGIGAKALGQVMGFIPYIGIFYSGARFGGINIYSGVKDISKGLSSGKFEYILKGLGTLGGIAGTAEFDRIYKGYIKTNTTNNKKRRTRKRRIRKRRTRKRVN